MREKILDWLTEEHLEQLATYNEGYVFQGPLLVKKVKHVWLCDNERQVVFSCKDENDNENFWALDGWYSSNYGTTLYKHSLKRVRPKILQIVEWEDFEENA